MPPKPTPAGIAIIAEFEKNQMTLDTSSWNTSVGNFKFASAIWMLAFDTVLYTVLGWYLDQVLPKEYGVALPPWFPCLKARPCTRPRVPVSTPSYG